MPTQNIKHHLIQIVGQDRVKDTIEDRIASSYDAFIVESQPDIIVFPKSAHEVSEILKISKVI